MDSCWAQFWVLGCPLLFQNYTGPEVLYPCRPEINSSACGVTAFESYTQALAYHTSTTIGQPLFLNETVQLACADVTEATGTIDEHCLFRTSRLTAYLVVHVYSDTTVHYVQHFGPLIRPAWIRTTWQTHVQTSKTVKAARCVDSRSSVLQQECRRTSPE